MTLLAVGEAMVDVTADAGPGSPTHALVRVDAGGTPVNAALAAAELGASAAVVARVGTDPAAAVIERALAGHDVEALLAIDDRRRTGVFVEVRGVVTADRGANDLLVPADLDGAPAHDALLVSGYTFRPATAGTARRALATSAARWRAVDLGGAPSGVPPGAANVLFATAAELGCEQPEAAARALAESYEVVVVKLGPAGALVASGDEARQLAPTTVAAQGAAGAGDALDAGVLVGLSRGLDPPAALALGLAAASSHICRRAVSRP